METSLALYSNSSTESEFDDSHSLGEELPDSPVQTCTDLPSSLSKASITAKAWAVALESDGSLLASKDAHVPREIASITKIMTCLVVIRFAEERKLPYSSVCTVSRLAGSMEGTTARLRRGNKLKLWDLLYGLMLPSGNDAAVCLAEFVGKRMLGMPSRRISSPEYQQAFVQAMNQCAAELGLHHTVYTNPHGMSTTLNWSTPHDVCLLASAAMQHEVFRKVVQTQEFSAMVYTKRKTGRVLWWKNTNRLLPFGWTGIKTGTTPNAGPCLCASLNGKLVVVLHCQSEFHRWVEARQLVSQVNSN